MQSVSYSVVAPMHNEEGNVTPLYEDIKQTMEGLGETYEIIFVNDASDDGTLAVMKDIQARDPYFHFADLETNVGENWALFAGVSKARGRIIITIDGDYQNDPRYIPALLSKLSGGYLVVSGRRQDRAAEFWTRRLPSRVANFLIRIISGVTVHDCGCGLKAYRREVLEGRFVPKGFLNRFSPVCFGIRRNEFAEIEIVDRPRIAGRSHYGLGRFFTVIRDLWVLPFAIRGPARWHKRFRLLLLFALTGTALFALGNAWLASFVMAASAAICFSNMINLKEFMRAQSQPMFQIKHFQ